MSQEPQGVALLRSMLDDGFAAGRTDVVDETCSPDLVEHQFGLESSGAEAFEKVRRAMLEVHTMSPDVVYEIEDWAQRDDSVWVRVRATGTMTGPFFGPPTGRPFTITVIDVVRVADGLVVEHWGVPDRFALLAQSGVLDRLKP